MAKSSENVIGETVVTPKGRVSFPHVFQKNTGGKYPSDKYELTLLFDKGTTDLKTLEAAALDVAKKAHGGKIKSLSDLVFPPIRDGDEVPTKGYQGNWFIKAKSALKPGVVGPDKRPLESEEDFYGGSYARMSVKPFSYMQGGKPGVTFVLANVQWLGHGERFGGGTTPEQDFDVVDEDMTASEAAEEAF